MAITYLSGERIQGLSYTAASSATHAVSTTSGSVATAGTKSSRAQECGFRVNAGHALVGKRPITITIGVFRASGLTSGVMKIAWRRASDSDGTGTALVDSATVNNSTLSVGDYGGGNYNWGDVTFTFPSGAETIEAGDYFLTNATVATGNDIKNKFKNANTESNIEMAEYPLNFNSNYEFVATVVYSVAAVGDAKPTNVQAGTRYEETDTRKFFRYKDEGYAAGIGSDANWTTVSNLTTNDAVTSPTGLGAKSWLFNGSSTALSMGAGGTSLFPTTSDFSMSMWWWGESFAGATNSNHNAPVIVPASGSGLNWEIGYRGEISTARTRVELSDGSNSSSTDTGGYVAHGMVDDTWYLWIYTFDASNGTGKLYKGRYGTDSNVSLSSSSGTSSCAGANNNGAYKMGDNGAEDFGNPDTGRMNDICIWNKILSSSEMHDMFNSESGSAGGTAKKATDVNKSAIRVYWDCQTGTASISNLASEAGWVEKGTA